MADLITLAQAATDIAQTLPVADAETAKAGIGSIAKAGGAIGGGLAAIGAAVGIGLTASAALNGSARQPEMAGDLKGTMILAAALIEGVALFAVVVGLLAVVL